MPPRPRAFHAPGAELCPPTLGHRPSMGASAPGRLSFWRQQGGFLRGYEGEAVQASAPAAGGSQPALVSLAVDTSPRPHLPLPVGVSVCTPVSKLPLRGHQSYWMEQGPPHHLISMNVRSLSEVLGARTSTCGFQGVTIKPLTRSILTGRVPRPPGLSPDFVSMRGSGCWAANEEAEAPGGSAGPHFPPNPRGTVTCFTLPHAQDGRSFSGTFTFNSCTEISGHVSISPPPALGVTCISLYRQHCRAGMPSSPGQAHGLVAPGHGQPGLRDTALPAGTVLGEGPRASPGLHLPPTHHRCHTSVPSHFPVMALVHSQAPGGLLSGHLATWPSSWRSGPHCGMELFPPTCSQSSVPAAGRRFCQSHF